MGNSILVVYACFFLRYVEKLLAQRYMSSELIYYKQYIDDAFGYLQVDEDPLQH
mgnify:CR=1 FL=1